MKKIIILILKIQAPELTRDILVLLNKYVQNIKGTGRFKKVELIPSPVKDDIVSISLFPNSEEEWEKYYTYEQSGIKKWFTEFLLEPKIAEEIHAFEASIN